LHPARDAVHVARDAASGRLYYVRRGRSGAGRGREIL
ncbi:hypothetical protein A2U01_0082123, partial [Trifolium medium]|nr:hypothetical protein [Trifolium medium]